MNEYGKQRCRELNAAPRSAAELNRELVRMQNMAAVCHCSAEINRGTYLYFSVNDMYLGNWDYLILLFSEISEMSTDAAPDEDMCGRMFQYALIREEASSVLEGQFSFYDSELDGRLVYLLTFPYGLPPKKRAPVFKQLDGLCRDISARCRERYDLDVMTYISSVVGRPEDLAAHYHKLLTTATLHRYINRKSGSCVYRLVAPGPGGNPIELDDNESAREIANAIVNNDDHEAVIRRIIRRMERSRFQSVDELRGRFGTLCEVLFRELKLRGLRLDAERARLELQTRFSNGNDWNEPVEWLVAFADSVAESRERATVLYSRRHFEQAERIIREKLSDPLLTERSIAAEIGISTSYLSVLFRRQTMKTPTRFIRDLRLQKAVELLQKTDLTIQQISDGCGFGSLETFHRVFKSEYGMTPGKLKQMKKPLNGEEDPLPPADHNHS